MAETAKSTDPLSLAPRAAIVRVALVCSGLWFGPRLGRLGRYSAHDGHFSWKFLMMDNARNKLQSWGNKDETKQVHRRRGRELGETGLPGCEWIIRLHRTEFPLIKSERFWNGARTAELTRGSSPRFAGFHRLPTDHETADTRQTLGMSAVIEAPKRHGCILTPLPRNPEEISCFIAQIAGFWASDVPRVTELGGDRVDYPIRQKLSTRYVDDTKRSLNDIRQNAIRCR